MNREGEFIAKAKDEPPKRGRLYLSLALAAIVCLLGVIAFVQISQYRESAREKAITEMEKQITDMERSHERTKAIVDEAKDNLGTDAEMEEKAEASEKAYERTHKMMIERLRQMRG